MPYVEIRGNRTVLGIAENGSDATIAAELVVKMRLLPAWQMNLSEMAQEREKAGKHVDGLFYANWAKLMAHVAVIQSDGWGSIISILKKPLDDSQKLAVGIIASQWERIATEQAALQRSGKVLDAEGESRKWLQERMDAVLRMNGTSLENTPQNNAEAN